MKIRIKLAICIIAVAVIPLLIVYLIGSTQLADIITDFQLETLKSINSDKSAYINEVLTNLSSDVRAFAVNETVRKFTDEYINGNYEQTTESKYTLSEINRIVKKSPDIAAFFIADNDGEIIISSNSDDVGTVRSDIDDLSAAAKSNGGISRIYPPKAAGECYFYIVRRIYSEGSKQIAIVCEEVSLGGINDIFSLTGYSNYGEILLVDSTGKYVMSSLANPRSIETVAEFNWLGTSMKEVIPFYGETTVTETVTAQKGNYTACGTVIESANWSLICVYNSRTARVAVSQRDKALRIVLFVFIAAVVAAGIFISIRFTEPVNRIIRVLSNLSHGDTNIRLDLKSKDEFGDLSVSFNKMFDDLFDSEQRYRTIVSMMDNIVFEINLKTYKIYVSGNFNQKFSFRAKSDDVNESFLYKMKVHKDDAKKYNDDVNAIVASSGVKWDGEYRMKNIYGDFSWIRVRGRKFYDRSNAPAKIIGMMVDIDREKKSTMTLLQKANYDALTQLFNRASFLRSLDEEMQLSVSRRSLDALMFVDLDDFKHFNDEFGHKCGDEVLKFVADTIKELTFDRGFGGRLGGDEFVMCLTNLKLIEDAGNVAAEMINILNAGFISESTSNEFNIHCSIGIAFFRENGGNSTELLEAADNAMYRIKKSGKSNYAYATGGIIDKTLL